MARKEKGTAKMNDAKFSELYKNLHLEFTWGYNEEMSFKRMSLVFRIWVALLLLQFLQHFISAVKGRTSKFFAVFCW